MTKAPQGGAHARAAIRAVRRQRVLDGKPIRTRERRVGPTDKHTRPTLELRRAQTAAASRALIAKGKATRERKAREKEAAREEREMARAMAKRDRAMAREAAQLAGDVAYLERVSPLVLTNVPKRGRPKKVEP